MKSKTTIPILYEDAYFFAVNKPPRTASVPGEDVPLHASVLGKIQKQYQEKNLKPYVLHRLDFPTSGVMLFGKQKSDRAHLEKIFKQPETEKKYVAMVKGIPRGKVIIKKLTARESATLVPAETHFKIMKIFPMPGIPLSLIEATIKTGRRHQIRKHFAGIGCPVILDSLYGDQKLNRKFRLTFRLGRLFLHAHTIHFIHPFSKKPLTITAPLPPDLQNVLEKLHYKIA